MKNIQAIRGMNDVLPDASKYWDCLESLVKKVVIQYGYQEIRFPILESTQLFSRAIGEVTDIVEKEMYTFLDRSGDSLTLRPEGTAGCIRAGIEHGLFYNKIQRLFYYGPMFRHERPQKGRYRQFHQFGVEVYGLAGPDIDVEIMLLAKRIWLELKIDHKVTLQINSLGTKETRLKYRERLVQYFKQHYDLLDEDCKRRLTSNPLRILDSKNPGLQDLISRAPQIIDYLDEESQSHFNVLCQMLDQIHFPYVVNPRLVRGLDYYDRTVFEWVPAGGGMQSALCAGGRYDNLVERMGGKSTQAIGFAMGLERLLSLVQEDLQLPLTELVYIVLLGDKTMARGMLLADELRAHKNIRVIVNCGGGDLSTQLKRADKIQATKALILGENELERGEIIVKYLRENKPQAVIKMENVINLV